MPSAVYQLSCLSVCRSICAELYIAVLDQFKPFLVIRKKREEQKKTKMALGPWGIPTLRSIPDFFKYTDTIPDFHLDKIYTCLHQKNVPTLEKIQ